MPAAMRSDMSHLDGQSQDNIEGKASGTTAHDTNSSNGNSLNASFIFGTSTGGIGAISVDSGVAKRLVCAISDV